MNEVLKVKTKYYPEQFDYEDDSKSTPLEKLIKFVLKDFMEKNKLKINSFDWEDNVAILSAVDDNSELIFYDFNTIDLYKATWEYDIDNNMTLTVIKLDNGFSILEKYNNMTLKEFVEKLNVALAENFTKEGKNFVKIRDVQSYEFKSIKISTNFHLNYTKNDVFVNWYKKPLLKMSRKAKETSPRSTELFLYSIQIIDYPNDENLSSLIDKTSKEIDKFMKNERLEEEKSIKDKMTKDYDEFIEVLNKHKLSIETFAELYKKFEGLSSQVQKELL